jgi:hypothetical protein
VLNRPYQAGIGDLQVKEPNEIVFLDMVFED